MTDTYPKFKAAVVQAAPVYLDRDASIEKACALIRQAGQAGAKLVALPEVFIPAYPFWTWLMNIEQGNPLSAQLYNNAVEVPSDATRRIGQAAREAQSYVVIGVNERDNKTLYNTLLYFDDQGSLIGKHRKFRATQAEKLIWGDGDGSTHQVYDTPLGRLGALACGEHVMALPGFTLGAMGEQVHVAAWVGGSAMTAWTTAFRLLSETASKYHAIAYNTFVLNVHSLVDQGALDILGNPAGLQVGGGCSSIIAPGTGDVIAGPLIDDEGILYADIDLGQAPVHYFCHEANGHYWPKPMSVLFDPTPHTPLVYATQAQSQVQAQPAAQYLRDVLASLDQAARRQGIESIQEDLKRAREAIAFIS